MIYCSNQHHSTHKKTTPLYWTPGCPLPLWELRHESLMLQRSLIEANDTLGLHTVDGSEIPSNHMGCIKPWKSWDIYQFTISTGGISIYRITYLHRMDLTTSTGEATMFLVVRRRKASSWWVDGLRNGWEVYSKPKEGVLGVTSLSETPTVSEAELASMLAVNNC